MIFLLCCFLLFCSVSGSHFRGGTISWTHVRNYEVQFFFKLGWVYGSGPGCTQSTLGQLVTGMNTTYWNCENGCGSILPLSNVNYICTGASVTEDFEQGERSFTYTFSGPGPFTVSFTGGAWISLSDGKGGNWNISTVVNLAPRSDTGRPNNSPQSVSKPAYIMQYNCFETLQIPVIDLDGDHIRCRWANTDECGGICNGVPSGTLDPATCTLRFPANHTQNGWFGVAITVEDFPSSTITAGGVTYTPNDAISAVPLQFLINTQKLTGSCTDRPKFVTNTPAEGQLFIIPAGQSVSINVYAQSSRTINSISLTAPAGVSQSSLQNDDMSRSDVKFIQISWTPTLQQKGSHILCVQADDIVGKTSDSRCFRILAWDTDPCGSTPCFNNATCTRTGYTDDFTCSCLPGFTGQLCQTDIDECASGPCLHDATCNDHINSYSCTCAAGYTGRICETDIDECASGPCLHNATCNDRVNGFSCTCVAGYTGRVCETDIDECASGPCLNNATCNDRVNGFSCTCVAGYTGRICETDIDECASAPCLNDATCNDHINSYSCTCVAGYTGRICETDIDECASGPCLHNATCNDRVNGFSCTCIAGYTGRICETDIDECASGPCLHNATCNDHVNEYSCTCVAGYTGIICETDIDECASGPCLHDATCNDHINSYSCTCIAGYTGRVCETDIDECSPHPCGILSECIDEINGYDCRINPLYLAALIVALVLPLLLLAFLLRRLFNEKEKNNWWKQFNFNAKPDHQPKKVFFPYSVSGHLKDKV